MDSATGDEAQGAQHGDQHAGEPPAAAEQAGDAQPAARQPGDEQPRVAEPPAPSTGTPQPEAPQPKAPQPDAPELDAQQPDAQQPDAQQPDAQQPDTQQPDAPEPDAPQPEAEQAEERLPDRAPTYLPAARPRSRRRRWAGALGYSILGLVSLLVFSATGYAWSSYHTLVTGIVKSKVVLPGPKSVNGDTNILVMGLDSRLDENGDPLPQAIYDQLHAGDNSEGGYNTNVLMLLHVPGDGSRATGISIPRDDYVDLPGKPDGIAKGKIKQAYGYAKDQRVQELRAQGMQNLAQLEQQSREAGRRETIETVRKFLGGVTIDHFVEVTLIGFYDIAKAVEPITVCVEEDTKDSFSGANLHKGFQQVDAAQALAFVRQRRDTEYAQLFLTDLDRERRQQAFIASVAFQLQQTGTFADPARLQNLIAAAKKDIVIDSGLDPLAFAQQSPNLTNGNVIFATLPITGFGKTSRGEDINVVSVPAVQAKVRELLGKSAQGGSSASPTGSSAPAIPPGATVDIMNATYTAGLAADVAQLLSAKGFTPGSLTSERTKLSDSTIYYGGNSSDAADALASTLGGVAVEQDPTLAAGRLRLVLGTTYSPPSTASPSSPSSVTTTSGPMPSTSASPSPSTSGSPEFSAAPTVQGGSVPCVK